MKTLILALFALAVPFSALTPAQADSHSPAAYAVLFYADWCGACKVLDPKVEEAKAKYDFEGKDVKFVKMDLTSRETIQESLAMADDLGIGEDIRPYGSKTGYMVVLSGDERKELARIGSTMSVDEIGSAVTKAL